MNILVIGSGAREHALAWKLSQDPDVHVFCSPGSDGMAQNFTCLAPANPSPGGYLQAANAINADLTVVGPEMPLVKGITDLFHRNDRIIFGPHQAAAMVTEGSKIECKNLLTRASVPTAAYYIPNDVAAAQHYITNHTDGKIVIKADGLAAGKGVMVCNSHDEALQAVDRIMVRKEFGEAGNRILIEERLYGRECSFMVITDGETAIPLIQAQDYKRQFNADQGPMTGGMGAFAPARLSPSSEEQIMHQIVQPTLAQLKDDGYLYRGVMYFGLMLTEQGPQVLEINCRFGDPETQVILPLLRSELAPVLLAAARGDGSLQDVMLSWDDGCAVGLTLAAPNYPGKPIIGQPIVGLYDALGMGAIIFHAGTAIQNGMLLTNGGRVLTLVSVGPDKELARTLAYTAAARIYFKGGLQMRSDIAAS